MIFGDRDELALEVDRFDPPWDRQDTDDESVWAAASIWVAGENITEHRRHGTDRLRRDLQIPLMPLARWFAATRTALHFEERSPLGARPTPHDALDQWSRAHPPAGLSEDAWLDRRDEWWHRHFTGSATQDVVAPSVGLVRNDDHAIVSWRVPDLPRVDRTFIRRSGSEIVSWPAVETLIDEFIAAVTQWTSVVLTAPPDERSAMPYYTGLAADEVAAFGFLPSALQDPAIDPLAQVVRDLTHQTATGPAQATIIDVVRGDARPGGQEWWSVRQRLIHDVPSQFEQQGYDAAQAVRSALGLDGQPIADADDFVRELDIEIAARSPPAVSDRMLVVGTPSARPTALILNNERTATRHGRRFELARAVGHLLLDPLRGDAVGAASGPLAMASRRRRSGAFAAELLLPTEALVEASGGYLDGIAEGPAFSRLLERFGVGANAAAFHLWNQGLLSSPDIRDDLIASMTG